MCRTEKLKNIAAMTEDCGNLEIYKASALSFIAGYTGLSEDEMDEHEDLTLAWLALINDMSLNREYTVKPGRAEPLRADDFRHVQQELREVMGWRLMARSFVVLLRLIHSLR